MREASSDNASDEGIQPIERQGWFADRENTPSWVNGAIVRVVSAVVGLVIVWWFARKLSHLLIIVFVSIFLSFAIEPAVNNLERRGVRRGIGTGVVFILVIGAIIGFGVAMGQAVAEQITDLINEAPARIASLETWLQDNIDDQIELEELQRSVSESGEFRTGVTGFAGGLVGFGGAVVSALLDIFTIVLFTFYLVAEGPKFRRTICSLLPPRQQKTVLEIWDIGTAKTGGYIVSRLILVVIALIVHWIAFMVIGVGFALVLAIFVGLVSQFVPVIGTYVAAVFPVLIALADRPISAVWVIVFMVVWQQLENYVISPRVTSQTMEVHPAVAFGSVLAGTAILGPVGALLALPVSATLQGFISTYVSRYSVEVDVQQFGEGDAEAFRNAGIDLVDVADTQPMLAAELADSEAGAAPAQTNDGDGDGNDEG